jgi:hypothetical protein
MVSGTNKAGATAVLRRLLIFLFLYSSVFGQGYEPFLIAPFQTGKSIGMEPWLSPQDAFPTLQNARVNKGVLEKRLGYQLFATMKHGAVAQSTTSIMGIHLYLYDGLPQLLIFDTKRVNRYNPVDDTMTDITGGSDIFSGGNEDFFSFANWLGVGYMTNNTDQIYKYTGSGNVAVFNITLSSSDDETNVVDTCRHIFIKNDRMLLLDVVEYGDWLPQRCRYSPVLSTDFSASGGGYVDAPTEERISSAGWVGNDLIVFFQGLYSGSIWKLRTTGDSDLPFRWEKVTTTNTSLAPYALVEFNDGVSVIGLNNILFYDGFKVQYLDLQKVRDIVDVIDTSKIRLSTAHNAIQDQRILYTYTASGSSAPDRVLDYNILEKSWSVYTTVDAHCFGTFDDQAVPIWTDADDIYSSDGALMSAMTLDSREILNDPFPFTLMGTRTSKVYKFGVGNYDGTDDASGTIALDVRSSRWNPYIREGLQAYLKNAVFLVDNDASASFSVSFYRNSRSTADRTNTVSCDSDDDGADKFWVSTTAGGTVGNFHRIKISHDARNNRPRIHAILLFMRRGGELNF